MSAQLTTEKAMSTRRMSFAIGPAFQTSARTPPLRVSPATHAPFVCLRRISGIITTSVRLALVLPLVLAVVGAGAPEAVAQEARAAVEAFVARVSDVRISDLVIDQNLTLYHPPDGQRRVSGGEQRMLFKLPQRQRVEQVVEGQREIPRTVGDRVWVRRADGKGSQAPSADPTRALAHLLVPAKRRADDLLAEWRSRGIRDDVSHVARVGARPVTVIGAQPGDRDVP